MSLDHPAGGDGCSGWMSSGWRRLSGHAPPWESCCDDHDRAYRRGGSRADRRHADAELRRCVAARGYPRMAWLIWLGVRAFGGPATPFAWRWGLGGPDSADYQSDRQIDH